MKDFKPYPREPYEPHKPIRSEFINKEATDSVTVYRDVEVLGDSDLNLDEYFKDNEIGDQRPAIPEKRYWQHLTLQDIVDLAPPGAKLSDISLYIDFPRYLEYIDLSFVHNTRNLKAEEKAFDSAMKEYEKDMIKYRADLAIFKKELAEYSEWEKQQEIQELENKLAKLKK